MNIADINQAEFQSIVKAVRNARKKDKKAEIIVKNDNKTAVAQAIEKYRKLNFSKVKIEWIPREQNTIADKLTH